MKISFFLAGIFLCIFSAKAQQTDAGSSRIGCIEPDTRLLLDEVRQHYAVQGFAVVRSAMLNMTSAQPFSVIIELSEKENYQIAFVANKDARNMETEVLAPNREKIFKESNRIPKTGKRVISFPLKLSRTDAYLFIMEQRLRHDDETCGGFLMLRDTLKNRMAVVVPF